MLSEYLYWWYSILFLKPTLGLKLYFIICFNNVMLLFLRYRRSSPCGWMRAHLSVSFSSFSCSVCLHACVSHRRIHTHRTCRTFKGTILPTCTHVYTHMHTPWGETWSGGSALASRLCPPTPTLQEFRDGQSSVSWKMALLSFVSVYYSCYRS